MNGSLRYIITRPCLSEGSLRLLKYLEPAFLSDGPAELRDDKGHSYSVRVDHASGRVWGLQGLYHDHNLGVNDVLLITPLDSVHFQVDCIVKPMSQPAPATPAKLRELPRRVVVGETAHVRAVRTERSKPAAATRKDSAPRETPPPVQTGDSQAPEPQAPSTQAAETQIPGTQATGRQTPEVSAPATPAIPEAAQGSATLTAGTPKAEGAKRAAPQPKPPRVNLTEAQLQPPAPQPPALPTTPEGQLQELAQLTGYQAETLSPSVLRLRAELGAQSYSVLLALAESGLQHPAWKEPCDYHALLVPERERPQGVPRLTLEALAGLLEHARLTPLSPIELRGYWNTGSFDLESVSSLAELISSQLSQRGTLSFVLMTLAQQPPHSVVSVPRLAERLGSGVNAAELRTVLETLSRPPLALLTPLSGHQYYLRGDVEGALRELSEYAEGLRRRIGVRAHAAD